MCFPFALHLTNGDSIPCQVSSYDKDSLAFQSPFIGQQTVNAAQVADSAESPFQFTNLEIGYMMGEGEGSCGEGSCGEGDDKEGEGSCGEGSCGEGSCGESDDKEGEGACGEGSCGGSA